MDSRPHGSTGRLLAGSEPAAQLPRVSCVACHQHSGDSQMNSIVYLVGLVVIVMAILSFVGMR